MTSPNAELLRSLGQLARGLSALFWGLPAALIICVETARASFLKPLGMIPALAATGLLLFGLLQMGHFKNQERPWRTALDRAKIFALVNFSLCPFLYWQNKMPQQTFFNAMLLVFAFCGVFFQFSLNVVLKQLGAILPDETLRHETRQFTALNRGLLVLLLIFRARRAVCLDQPLQLLGVDLFRAAAAGDDHGANLENQRSDPRRRLRFAVIDLQINQAANPSDVRRECGCAGAARFRRRPRHR